MSSPLRRLRGADQESRRQRAKERLQKIKSRLLQRTISAATTVAYGEAEFQEPEAPEEPEAPPPKRRRLRRKTFLEGGP